MVEPLIFLGAGASRPFGIPTMKEMVTLFEEELRERDPAKDLYRQLSAELRSLLEPDNIDLETVFTLVDGLLNFRGLDDLGVFPSFVCNRLLKTYESARLELPYDKEQLRSLRQKFEDFIKRECWPMDAHRAEIVSTYSRLFHQIKALYGGANIAGKSGVDYSDWSIFTTNYDLCLEYLFAAEKVPIFAGFQHNPQTGRSELDSRNFHSIGGIPKLVKLHGSLSWIRLDDDSVVEYRDRPPETTFDGRKRVGEIMVYPIQQKATYLPPFIDMFFLLSSALKYSQNWLVIGYSFNDEVIREMFIANSSSEKRLVCVHPRASEIQPRRLSGIKAATFNIDAKFGPESTTQEIVAALREKIDSS